MQLTTKNITLLTKVHIVKAMVFPIVMYRCEIWTIKKTALKNWFFQTGAEREGPLDSKEIKLVNSKGNQPWTFIARTDAEAPILWPPEAKRQLTGKAPDAEKEWEQEEKGATEDEMVGWHHQLNRHEFSKLQEIVKDREAQHATVNGVTKSQTWPSN